MVELLHSSIFLSAVGRFFTKASTIHTKIDGPVQSAQWQTDMSPIHGNEKDIENGNAVMPKPLPGDSQHSDLLSDSGNNSPLIQPGMSCDKITFYYEKDEPGIHKDTSKSNVDDSSICPPSESPAFVCSYPCLSNSKALLHVGLLETRSMNLRQRDAHPYAIIQHGDGEFMASPTFSSMSTLVSRLEPFT